MKLNQYNKKRNFNSTNEPKGEVKSLKIKDSFPAKKGTTKNKKIKRFVIQHHLARKEHFDFRLEYNGVLLSFAVPKGLPNKKGEKHLAVHVEDHPLDYINFEGKIPKGNYGAGTVDIFDKGYYIPFSSIRQGIKKGHIKIILQGEKVSGSFSLILVDEPNWIIIKSDDMIKNEINQKEDKNKSKTKKTKKIENPLSSVDVKLCTLTNVIPKNGYLFEIKYDGYRIVAYVNNKIKLKTRNNIDYTSKFSCIVESLQKLNHSMILDGEVVAFDENGRSNFSLLTDRIKDGIQNFCYVVFDILAIDGKSLLLLPLIKRKQILENHLINLPKNIIISSYVLNKGKESFTLAKKLNLEGIVAKKIDSVYNGDRDENWLKIKCYKRQEFVIGGYSITDKNKNLSALYVGYYDKTKLIFIGKVGTGFNENIRQELNQKFKKLIRKTSPFTDFEDKNAIYLSPNLVCEIQFAEITKNNLLRQPSFLALRTDKDAKQVFLEQ